MMERAASCSLDSAWNFEREFRAWFYYSTVTFDIILFLNQSSANASTALILLSGLDTNILLIKFFDFSVLASQILSLS